MIARFALLALMSALSTAPAFAQKAATGATVPRPMAPPDPSKAEAVKASTQAEMVKAQKAAAARDKAWDTRTRNSMSSICKGC